MKLITFLFFLSIFNLALSQEINNNGTYFNEVIKNPIRYKKLILHEDEYLKFDNFELNFINVKSIIISNAKNLLLPNSFKNFENLEELIIVNSNNINLKHNTKVILTLKKLTSLEITNCNLKKIPLRFLKLSTIKKISFSNNAIKNLSVSIKYLKAKRIDLSHNLLSQQSISRLSCNNYVEELYLDFSNIECFPKDLGKMENLKLLSITFNKINKIDNKYYGFKQLELLSITGNYLKINKEIFVNNNFIIIDNINNGIKN